MTKKKKAFQQLTPIPMENQNEAQYAFSADLEAIEYFLLLVVFHRFPQQS